MTAKTKQDTAALELFERFRWNGKPVCPYCGKDRVGPHRIHGRMNRWQCRDCHRSFRVLVGTIFEGTHVPLPGWLRAIALFWKQPPSIMDIHRAAGVKYDTAKGVLDTLTKGFSKKDELLLKLAAHLRRYPPK